MAFVDRSDAGNILQNIDALVTREQGLPLFLRYADCVPILLWDPVQSAVGIVHAGWRGSVLRLVTRTFNTMRAQCGSHPSDIVACIGPSIGPCCYLIREDVASQVKNAFGAGTPLLIRREGHLYFDLWNANRQQLDELGVSEIEVAQVCTAENIGDFYSARAEHDRTGRFGALIALS